MLEGILRPPATMRKVLAVSFGLGGIAIPQAALHAEISPNILVNVQIPEHMAPYQDRGAAEQDRSDWSARGVDLGAFKVLPKVSLTQLLTSNAYATAKGKASPIERVELDVRAQSQWSRHAVSVGASRRLDYYFGHKDRNEDNWTLNASADVDVTDADQINIDADINRAVFNILNSDFTSGTALTSGKVVAMNFDHQSIGGTRRYGSARFVVQAERYHVNFLNADRFADTRTTYLDHDIYQASAQGEYSFTPTFAVFSRVNYVKTDYGAAGNLNSSTQSSHGTRFALGTRAAVPGLGRASVALAYSDRSYGGANVPNVSGFSIQGRVELFVTPLTTVSAEAGSRIADTQLVSTQPNREKFVQLGADHALLRNCLLGVEARLIKQKPLSGGLASTYASATFRGNYYANRRVELGARVSYSSRSYAQSARPSISELVGGMTFTYHL